MIRTCPTCGNRATPTWRTRIGIQANDLATRSQAEEAADWFRTHYPDPWHLILARREAAEAERRRVRAPGRHTTKRPA